MTGLYIFAVFANIHGSSYHALLHPIKEASFLRKSETGIRQSLELLAPVLLTFIWDKVW